MTKQLLHSGLVLKAYLNSKNMTPDYFALEVTGYYCSFIEKFIAGERDVDEQTAYDFGEECGILTKQLWLDLQLAYDMAKNPELYCEEK